MCFFQLCRWDIWQHAPLRPQRGRSLALQRRRSRRRRREDRRRCSADFWYCLLPEELSRPGCAPSNTAVDNSRRQWKGEECGAVLLLRICRFLSGSRNSN